MTPIVWHPEARAEFDGALARSTDPSEFQRDTDVAVLDVGSSLYRGPRIRRTPCREVVLTRLPYRLVYLEGPTAVTIIAFAHHRRRSKYWVHRLP